MPEMISAIILGIVEGLTEFLPVSSTGHLILAGALLGFEGGAATTFKIVIQLGAVMAVLVLYWTRYMDIAKDLLTFNFSTKNKLNAIHMMIAMIPALIVYLIFKDYIKRYLFGPAPVLIGLVAGGILMIAAARLGRKVTAENTDDITYKQALGIGLFQCFALWPGFSRSGSTISGGLLLGTSQKAAADFTFIISVPVMLGATVLDMYDSRELLTADALILFLIGFIAAFIVAMIAVVTFLNLIKRLKLEWFALYRFVLAAVFYIFVM
ncbi:undecaprenyl-diphosphate phosphatase [Paenibacillus validus]|uniref:undecaprenyl-diphosphate phosphatase n=1 Tax=Paenibacillus validus TaxID=44253 RepID=UPI000FD8A750|nr:undecaprenyl-diphosphate phosphatase [Paenibacillus validus]MED4599452.1 undecaprenyl-diphosphate phosphatase [Paenibacillus validus]MED4605164.1 undecaprenyl-diphosphate phosphatase [Paenibacillus validus]